MTSYISSFFTTNHNLYCYIKLQNWFTCDKKLLNNFLNYFDSAEELDLEKILNLFDSNSESIHNLILNPALDKKMKIDSKIVLQQVVDKKPNNPEEIFGTLYYKELDKEFVIKQKDLSTAFEETFIDTFLSYVDDVIPTTHFIFRLNGNRDQLNALYALSRIGFSLTCRKQNPVTFLDNFTEDF